MTAKPPHDRRLALLEVSLTQQKLKKTWGSILDSLRDEVEQALISSHYLDGAPFWWVTLAIRYGLKYDEAPSYERIDKKYGDLPLGIEIDVRDLIDAPEDEVRNIFTTAILKSLIHAGERYGRPIAELQNLFENVGDLQA